MRRLTLFFTLLTLLALLPLESSTAQQEVVLTPSKDNTLYQDTDGAISNGAGSFLFFGATNQGALRRALMMFDVAGSLPAGAQVQSATLQITVTKTIAPSSSVTVHRVQQDWGEGTSDASGNEGAGTASTANDATWKHTFFDGQVWDALGGDFDSGALTSTQAGSGGAVDFPSTDDLVALVQSWLDTPAENFGVILIGNENSSPTTKRIGSREGAQSDRPQLTVSYSMPTAAEGSELPAFLTELSAYPNPATGAATIRYTLSETRDVEMQIVDITGRRVAIPVASTVTAGSHSLRLETDDMTPGVYLVRLVSEGLAYSKPLVVR